MFEEEGAGVAIRRRLGAFVRLLRGNGFAVGLAETQDGLKLLADPVARHMSALAPAMRTLFCGDRSDWKKFDDIFAAFWLRRGVKTVLRAAGSSRDVGSGQRLILGTVESCTTSRPPETFPQEGEEASPAHGNARQQGASATEHFEKTDFRHMTHPAEIEVAHALAERLARAMQVRLTRRCRTQRARESLDLRRTIHRSIAYGGTPIELFHRRRKMRPLKLVLLLDASGSMSVYASVFLRFLHAVMRAFLEAEAFLFHTRLTHISPALREKDPLRAVERLSLLATGIGGGTRIGESLATFNRWHARRVIHSRTAVVVISDGYDTGEPEKLGREMRQMRRRCRRIVWLNPMLGWPGYEPEARGMKAALPFLDLFAPAHNLESLAALEAFLARL